MNAKKENNVIYCSTSSKSSIEDGTELNPYKTLDAAFSAATDNTLILLNRNCQYDLFTTLKHKSISIDAYGAGAVPVISGFIKVRNTNKNLFVKDSGSNNIWTLNFDRLVAQSGHTAEELSNIGFIYNPYTQTIVYGSRVAFETSEELLNEFETLPTISQLQAYSTLDKDGDFYQSRDGRTIKVYSSNNPNESSYPQNYNKPTYGTDPRSVQELWIAVDRSFMMSPHDCEVQNIKLIGFGRNCFEGMKSNVVIHDVTVDIIGGCVLDLSTIGTKNFKRAGVAFGVTTSIESRVTNVMVKNCHISRVFDSAFSLHGPLTQYMEYGAENISFVGNTIENCAGINATMYYINASGWVHGTSMVKNCRFSGNKVFFSYDNCFNSIFLENCCLNYGIPGFEVTDNVFYNSPLMLRTTSEFGFDMGYGNICYVRTGGLLFSEYATEYTELYYPSKPDVTNVDLVISEYRSAAHDCHTVFIGIESIVSPPGLYRDCK